MTQDQRLIELHYDAALMRRVVRRYWLRSVGLWLALGTGFLGVPALLAYLQGDRSWLLGAFGAAFAIVVLTAWRLYDAHLSHSMTRLRRLDNGYATMQISDDGLVFTSAAGMSLLAWREFKEAWLYPDFWLLLIERNQFLTLPTRDLNGIARALVLSRLTAAGARIRGSATSE